MCQPVVIACAVYMPKQVFPAMAICRVAAHVINKHARREGSTYFGFNRVHFLVFRLFLLRFIVQLTRAQLGAREKPNT
jgi:hypothetical protein